MVFNNYFCIICMQNINIFSRFDKTVKAKIMKLFTTRQIAGIDRYTIENEPVKDIDLMERAAWEISQWLIGNCSYEQKMVFFAGPGNNGGDALAIARQMAGIGYECEVYLSRFGKELKGSPAENWERLKEQGKAKLSELLTINNFPETDEDDLLIDGLFGSGLTRPIEGLAAEIVKKINNLPNTTIAIDIPSGLMGEDNSRNISENIITADYTLTFQFPKISFFFAENECFTGKWEVLPIGLHPEGIARTPSPFALVEKEDVRKMIPPRSKFAHKGTFGHALLIAGSYGKTGAAVLAAKGALRAGTGLLTVHVPKCGYPIIQTAIPEAMASVDIHEFHFTQLPELTSYSAIGIGPGLGTEKETALALFELIEKVDTPLILDADALNILSENKAWLKKLPENSILTPHPGEFERLAGKTENSWQRIQKQMQLAQELKVIIVLKGAHTSIALPDGKLLFNSTGNPGMATAGSGDALTGIILGLLAQKIPAAHAAIAGVFLHGLAGDLAVREKSENALIAGDINEFLGKAFAVLK